jgi:hypothetical protein
MQSSVGIVDFGSRIVGVIRDKPLARGGRNSLVGSLEGEGAAKLIWGPAPSDSGEVDVSITSCRSTQWCVAAGGDGGSHAALPSASA